MKVFFAPPKKQLLLTYKSPAKESASEKVASKIEVPTDDDGPGAGGGYDTFEAPADNDGPGAGGGYDDKVDNPSDSDGPGAGGGYDDEVESPSDSDGPGAGGGYDDDADSPADSDGPGAGGGYDGLSDGPGAGGGYHGLSDSLPAYDYDGLPTNYKTDDFSSKSAGDVAVTTSWGSSLTGNAGYFMTGPNRPDGLVVGQTQTVSGEWYVDSSNEPIFVDVTVDAEALKEESK